MITVSQVREHLIDLLAASEDKESALSSFEEWLSAASWNMHLDSEIRAQQFAGEVLLYLAEMDAENHDCNWLLRKLRSVLTLYPTEQAAMQVFISTASSNSTTHQEWAFSPVGNSRAVAFG